MQNTLPQTFRLALVSHENPAEVTLLDLDESNTLELDLDFDEGSGSYTLVVMGSTRFTRQPAAYRFEFIPE